MEEWIAEFNVDLEKGLDMLTATMTTVANECALKRKWAALVRTNLEELIGAGEEDLDANFSAAEFNAQIIKLKKKKTPDLNQVINELSIALTGDSKRKILEWINALRSKELWPDFWREGIICPIFKAGNEQLPSNYRRIILLNVLYKLVMAMIAKRISNWVEVNKKSKESQASFRKRYSTRDHLFILNTLIENRFCRKGKLYVLFLDLKVTFDSVDREKLFEKIWKMGIRGHMLMMIRRIYEKTRNRIRIADSFWTDRRMRQGCPLSPILFLIFLNDLEDNWMDGTWVALRLEIGKCTVLTKSKIVIFCRGERRAREEYWWFEDQQMEVHLRKRTAKTSGIVNRVWGLVKRSELQDFDRLQLLFDSLRLSVVTYGVEIWGLRLCGEVERMSDMFALISCKTKSSLQ
uniref:Reverse transcriptase domain-containing protein n=1 Tax=Strigamia maritima TaxID=126957 RepID=T1IR50_STRMM